MLHLIRKNKAGQSFGNHGVHWRSLFKASEDSLTSTIFERLFYLPHDLAYRIIQESCYGNHLPVHCGRLITKEFWPHWGADETTNSLFVEPDVFIRYTEFDLIIEAKRWDKKQQSTTQWGNEIKSYKNEYGLDKKPVYLIALGGIYNQDMETIDGVKIIKSQWKNILKTIIKYSKIFQGTQGYTQSSNSIMSIFEDLIISFEMHGYSTGVWFEDFLPSMANIQSTGSELQNIKFNE